MGKDFAEKLLLCFMNKVKYCIRTYLTLESSIKFCIQIIVAFATESIVSLLLL